MITLAELSEIIIGSFILASGLVAIALAASRKESKDRTAIWFGVFACLYSVRLTANWELVRPLFSESFWRYLDAFITYAIIVPIVLFVESLVGPGWRRIVRRTWQVAMVYAFLAILNDLIRQNPGATLWLNPPAVLISVGIATFHVLAYSRHEHWPQEFRVAIGGGLIFFSVAMYQTFGGKVDLEPLALLIFVISVGYLVAKRLIASERRLVAMSRELDLAREIQESILPRELPTKDGLRVAACYLPMSKIGGDFYDFDTRRPSCLGVMIADVSGHGVPAALVASMLKMGFAAEADRLHEPGLALQNINRMLCGKFAGAYVTASCGFIDPINQTLKYANAGHPAPLLRRKDGRIEHLDQGGLLLAFDGDAQYPTAEVALRAGDRIVFFSDGLIEASNVDDDLFGNSRVEQLLAANAADTPEEVIDRIVTELRRWVGSESHLQDDVTLVVIDVGRPLSRSAPSSVT